MGLTYYDMITSQKNWKFTFENKTRLFRNLGGFLAIGFSSSFIYTWYFTPYCDIDSHLYNTDSLSRAHKIAELKKRLTTKGKG